MKIESRRTLLALLLVCHVRSGYCTRLCNDLLGSLEDVQVAIRFVNEAAANDCLWERRRLRGEPVDVDRKMPTVLTLITLEKTQRSGNAICIAVQSAYSG